MPNMVYMVYMVPALFFSIDAIKLLKEQNYHLAICRQLDAAYRREVTLLRVLDLQIRVFWDELDDQLDVAASLPQPRNDQPAISGIGKDNTKTSESTYSSMRECLNQFTDDGERAG
ncbi:hypothetical protein ACP4OV_018973 [Aristida adscensionis]